MQYLGGGGSGGELGTAVASGAVQLAVDQSTGNLVAVGGRVAGPGRRHAPGRQRRSKPRRVVPGLANLAGNWAVGGLSGALFGLPAGASGMGAAIELGVDVAGLGWAATDATAGVAGSAGRSVPWPVRSPRSGSRSTSASLAFGPDPGPVRHRDLRRHAGGGPGSGLLSGPSFQGSAPSSAPCSAALGGSAGVPRAACSAGSRRLTHAQREQRETSRVLGAASAGQADILSARTYQDLYDKLITYSSGYVGGTSGVALSPSFGTSQAGSPRTSSARWQGALIRLPPQFGGVEDFMATNMDWSGAGAGADCGPAGGPGNQNPYYPTVTYEGFREIALCIPTGFSSASRPA